VAHNTALKVLVILYSRLRRCLLEGRGIYKQYQDILVIPAIKFNL